VTEIEDPFGWLGAVLADKYRIDAVVGEGGFGVVYRAFHLGFAEHVAVKCLKVPERLKEAERTHFEGAFLEEGRLLHKLSRATADVVQALDVGTASSPRGAWTPYIVLEWLDGTTLEADLQGRADTGAPGRSLSEAMVVLGPAVRALAVAHRQGIAHRDVKPANLFLTHAGGIATTKVLDFGIAKVMSESASLTRAYRETGASIRAFSAGYGAPEQFNPDIGATGPWTDVFALALILVELMTGTPALRGADTMQLYVQASDRNHRPTPRARGATVSDEAEAVFARALSVEPRDRHATADAFWEELVRASGFVAPPPSSVQRPSAPRTVAAAPVSARTVPSSPFHLDATRLPAGDSGTMPSVLIQNAPPPSTVRRGSSRAVPVAIALVAVAGIAIFVGTRVAGSRTPAVPTTPTSGESSPAPAASSAPAVPTPTTAPDGMVVVAAATFTMGTDDGPPIERPAHGVAISRPFFLDATEVTSGHYKACVARGKCTPSGIQLDDRPDTTADDKFARMCNATRPDRDPHPINCVGHAQAAAFCAYVGKRLPTEAEWELAARGTDGRRYAWGNAEPTCELAMFSKCGVRLDGLAFTKPVGSFPAGRSAAGALDMSGNVWEWVADKLDAGPYPSGPQTDPQAAGSSGHGVLRGGSWDFAATHLTTTIRTKYPLGSAHVSTGFRCAQSVSPATENR
jgi:formylglycine-generating enzyme required for sulfatase activity